MATYPALTTNDYRLGVRDALQVGVKNKPSAVDQAAYDEGFAFGLKMKPYLTSTLHTE